MNTTQQGRFLGIDYGTKRIGLAISDETASMAFSHGMVSNDATAVDKVVSLIKEKGIVGIVMGESKDFAMADNPVMKHAREFAISLTKATGVPVEFEHEFLSSHQARTTLHELGVTASRGDGTVDAGAAAIVLQTRLDRMKFEKEGISAPYHDAFDGIKP
jgi:putative Holliday junction resolvase